MEAKFMLQQWSPFAEHGLTVYDCETKITGVRLTGEREDCSNEGR